MGVKKSLAPISVTSGQCHLATAAGPNLLCCHDKGRTGHPIATKLKLYRCIPLVMLSTCLNSGEFCQKLAFFFETVQTRISQLNIIFVQWMWNKKEMSQLDATLTRVSLTFDIWPWIFKVKFYLRNGRRDCHGTKGMGVDRMPLCETLRKWVNWMLRWLGYLWPWPWIFIVKLYLGNGAWLSWN